MTGAAPRRGSWSLLLPVGIVGCTLLLLPSAAAAQLYRWGVDIGMAGMTSYPRQLSRCIESAGIAPSARAYFRPHRLVGFEAGASMQFVLSSKNVTDCGFFPPLLPGMTRTVHEYDATRSNHSLVTEGRVVLTPTGDRTSTFRLIGGAAKYPGNDVHAWIAGLGLLVSNSWGAVIVDGEHWWVGTGFMRGTFVVGEDGTRIWQDRKQGREWERLGYIRVGLLIWSR